MRGSTASAQGASCCLLGPAGKGLSRPRKLDYADDAIEDLDAIQHWLVQPGAGEDALGRLKLVYASIQLLRQTPCLYPVVDQPGVRELPCPNGYRVLYELNPDIGSNDSAGDVMVLRVFDPGQDRTIL